MARLLFQDIFYFYFFSFFEPGETKSVICQQVDGKSLAFFSESVSSKPYREKLKSKQTTIAMSFAFALFISWKMKNRQNFGFFFSLSQVFCISAFHSYFVFNFAVGLFIRCVRMTRISYIYRQILPQNIPNVL